MAATPSLSTIRAGVDKALDALIDQDLYLLLVDVSERAICHRLASHLQDAFGSEWSVDCEYNREGKKPKTIVNKQTGDPRAVYPDIVVHRRGASGPNLLAIEVKKGSTRSINQKDKSKLGSYVGELGYTAAVFIEIPVGQSAVPIAPFQRWIKR